ncbi:DUF433 domain-containing protein [Nocardia cyriacigeorgica]|uniref:DUF433 domain-containing protein n=1 Tax=Nocardia cyriacigeorgica TaxID=135487 RepID=A0A5R8PJA8_9NOCA|nr:DUF433 domain-containing protein [Nocardia cyriacigeorgica]TLG14833.1 DUF433 domain-containing protein [Nocardia cyriacigeorgica]
MVPQVGNLHGVSGRIRRSEAVVEHRRYACSVSRITFDPNQCGGRPCIRGMRIRVSDILELLAAGETEDSILEDYPYLEREDIRACLAFAAAEADHPILRTAS